MMNRCRGLVSGLVFVLLAVADCSYLRTNNISMKRGGAFRNLQAQCFDGLELTTIEEYYLLELLATPGQIKLNDTNGLEMSFLTSWNFSTSCQWNDLQVVILDDIIDDYSNVSGISNSSSQRTFSYVLWLQAQLCQSTNCEAPASIFTNSTGGSRGRRTLDEFRSLQQVDCPFSVCTLPSVAQFLASWKKENLATSVEIQALTPLFISDGCPLTPFGTFSFHVEVTLETTEATSEWTDENLDTIAQLFIASYNQMNILNPLLCDPKRRQVTQSQAKVTNIKNTTTTLQLDLTGPCQNCENITSLFDIGSSEFVANRALQESEDIACLCPNVTDSLLRGPTLAEFTSEFQLALEQDLSSVVEVLVRLEEISPIPCNEPIVPFESSLFVDYQGVCGSLTDSDIALLEQGILETYNALTKNEYCDPYFRRILNVIYNTTEAGAIDGRLTVGFLVNGTCRDCELATPLFDTVETNELESLNSNLVSLRNQDFSDACSCPDQVVADRAPTEEEFLQAYQSVLLDLSEELICVTTLFGATLPTESPSSAPTELAFNCSIEFSTAIISSIAIVLNENATQSSLDELGLDVVNTYNALINETYSTCQTSKYRQITSFSIVSDATSARKLGERQDSSIPIVTIDGGCSECAPGQSNSPLIFFQLDGGCAGCDSEQLFFDPEVISQDDFVAYYSSAVDVGLDFFSEIEVVDCPGNITIFEDVVIVEYVPGDLGDTNSLLDDEFVIQKLEELYVKAYNDLSRNYCDPFARQLESAKIVLVGENNTFGNIPVEMQVVGTCANCDGLNMSVYDLPSVISESLPSPDSNETDTTRFLWESLDGRAIQGPFSTCYCPAHPVGNRAPYEVEFLDAYRNIVNATTPQAVNETVRQALTNIDLNALLSVAECQFGTEFQTGIYVQFEGNREDLTDEVIQEIEESLRLAIIALYQNTLAQCNPDFRIVESVEATIVVDIVIQRTLQQYRQRMLQVPVVTQAPSTTPAPSLTPAPSISFTPSFSIGAFPTQVPTAPTLASSTVDVLLYVSGLCNGCSNEVTLGNQVSNARRLEEEDDDDPFRQLFDSEATSQCFCQIGAVINTTQPSINDLLALFSANLVSSGVPFVITEFSEVPVIDCTVPITTFQTQFQYDMSLDPDVTESQLQAVADLVMTSYNDLSDGYCDPQDQKIEDIQLTNFVPLGVVGGQDQCTDFRVTFGVTGSCRGCMDGSSLLDTTAQSRRLDSEMGLRSSSSSTILWEESMVKNLPSGSIHAVRRLQVGTGVEEECFCTGDVVASRAPNEAEFDNALGAALEEFQVTNVCGLSSFVPSSEPTLLPTIGQSATPTSFPSSPPTLSPTSKPTPSPTVAPTFTPTLVPSDRPTVRPTVRPTMKPSEPPTKSPAPTALCFGVVCETCINDCVDNGGTEGGCFEFCYFCDCSLPQ